jgi:signal peptidase II
MKKAGIIIFFILILDQVLKVWIKTHMTLGQETVIFNHWFLLHFTENEGMAFGLSLGGDWGKLMLSLIRVVAIIVIGMYLYRLTKKNAPFGLILSFSLILAGAAGNMIDSAFYGMIFGQSSYHTVAQIFPEGGGYNSFLYGKVVDMFYFPLYQGYLPDWLPVWSGQRFIFFRPVFNIADSSITIGVIILILFQRKFFKK